MLKMVDLVATTGNTRTTGDGYLVTDARIARTGIQLYLGSEVGKPDMNVVRVYRPGEEVFSDETMKSAAHKPVTNNHPPEMVSADNWKQYAVGQTADEIVGESRYIRVPMMVSDAAAIEDIKNGKRQLSAGYTCTLDFTPGITAEGEKYDAIQRDIRLNHVAIVQVGRAGKEVRIGDDAAWGISPLTDTEPTKEKVMTRTVTVDGIPVETTEQGAIVIDTLTKRLENADKNMRDAQAAHAKELATKDAELAKKDAEIDALKAKQLSDADLNKRVQERAGLIATAQKLVADTDFSTMSDADIRLNVVKAKLGDAAVTGKSADYINARFDILAEDAAKTQATGVDPFRAFAAPGLKSTDAAVTVDTAYNGMVNNLENAWKTTSAA